MMSAFECYREYIALKQHFTQKNYDYIKYNGKVKTATEKSFNARRDKLFFMKLAKHQDPKNFMIANMIETSKTWIGELAYNEEAQKRYIDWSKRIQSLTYNFKIDINKLNENFDSNFVIEDYSHPYALRLYLQKEISLETLVILLDLVRCFKYWNNKMDGDPIWDEISLRILKYRPFLNYDVNKLKQMVIDKFE